MFDIDAIPAAHRIPRISAKAAPLFFDEFYRSERPVIITGLVKQWPCFDKWSIDYFKSIIGAHTHTFRYEEGRTIALSVAAYLDVLAASEDGGDGYRTSTRSLRAVPSCCTRALREGDVVFFPQHWYHYFHNITGAISVTTQSCSHDDPD